MRTNVAFQHLLRTIEPSMIDRIFQAMAAIEARHGAGRSRSQVRRITLFGGEPLLARLRPVIEYIISASKRSGGAEFSAVTNATELSAYEDLLGADGITSLQITLDGPRSEHDKRRIYPDGTGSFERIAENITMALRHGVTVGVRTNVDKRNIAFLPALADEIVSRGWDKHPQFSAYAAVIVPTYDNLVMPTGMAVQRNTMSSWQLDDQLSEMRTRYPNLAVVGRPDEGLALQIRRLFDQQSDPLPNFKAVACGAHGRMYLFDPFGDIYACWEKTGDSSIRIGHILEDGTPKFNAVNTEWRSRTVASNPVCRRCRFALYCGGGCAASAVRKNGEFLSNYCDGFASRFRAMATEAYVTHAYAAPASARARSAGLPC
jgi:uncharacterized protein